MSESKFRKLLQEQIFYYLKDKAKQWIKSNPLEKLDQLCVVKDLAGPEKDGLEFDVNHSYEHNQEFGYRCFRWAIVYSKQSAYPVTLQLITDRYTHYYYLYSSNMLFKHVDNTKDICSHKEFCDENVIILLKNILNFEYDRRYDRFFIRGMKEVIPTLLVKMENSNDTRNRKTNMESSL